MPMAAFIAYLVVVGLLGAGIAKALVPDRRTLPLTGTMLVSMVGSIAGGLFGLLLADLDGTSHLFDSAGIIGAALGTAAGVLMYRRHLASRAAQAVVKMLVERHGGGHTNEMRSTPGLQIGVAQCRSRLPE